MATATTFLSDVERRILQGLAATIIPPGRLLPGAGPQTAERAEAWVARIGAVACHGYRALLWSLELSTVPRFGRRFSGLPLGRQLEVLESWRTSEARRVPLRALLAPIKAVHFDSPEVAGSIGCRYAVEAPVAGESAPWTQQITDASTFDADVELECDAVVVGTGAGGGPVAKALADAGFAVLMLEEGRHFTRRDFNGRSIDMMSRLYRNGGATVSVGNTAIPIPVGKAVGGSTLINSGTCFRAPESTLAQWRDEFGIGELTMQALEPHYAEVEKMLEIAPGTSQAIGRTGELIARGCDALGYSHAPLLRNAPGCDGQGLCCFGCPTDAKRSSNITWVPSALQRSAELFTGVRVERVLVENAWAVGVVGIARSADGTQRTVTVRAGVVVLACGSLYTPTLLLRNGLANGSGQVGRNLSIHPAAGALALFDEPVHSWRSIPQGYAIDEFKEEGILFEGASVPLDTLAATHTGFGPSFVSLMERFNQTLGFGYMVKDTSRGRVRPGPGGQALITYNVNAEDLARLRRGMEILCRVYFAAGAREVHPGLLGFEALHSERDVEKLSRANLSARHFDLTAYHPLGTARMGPDPRTSVVGPTHEAHEVRNLFVCDGSAMPGALGVNPQVTIMAMALRASSFIARRLERQTLAA